MRIAVLLGEVTGKGGMETVISDTVRLLNQSTNHQMKVFVLGGSRDEMWLRKMGSSDYYLLCATSESKAKRYLKCIFRAPEIIKDFQPDIILGADEKSVLYALLIKRFSHLKFKIGSWIHFSLTSISPMYKKFIKKADFHLAISKGLMREYIESGLADHSNVYLVYNPLETNCPAMTRPKDVKHFIYVGRLIFNGQKRVNDLLEALSHVPGEWKLSVIGDGKDEARLMSYAIELGIHEKISWLGWKEHPFDSINDASVLLLTSEYEGFPMVLLEAMARGIPCISTDCPVGPSDIVINNINGWLYPMGDNKALSNLLNQIVRGKLSLPHSNQVKKSVEKYDVKHFTEKLKTVFEEV